MTERNLPHISILREHFTLDYDHPDHVVWSGMPAYGAAVNDVFDRSKRFVLLGYICVAKEDAIAALEQGHWPDDATAWHVHDAGPGVPNIHRSAWELALQLLHKNSEIAAGAAAGADRATDAGIARHIREHRHHNFPDGGVQIAAAGQKEATQ